MKFALLDTAVLNRDLPEHGLRAGDLGAVVELSYGADALEVEFVQASGRTKALLHPPGEIAHCAPRISRGPPLRRRRGVPRALIRRWAKRTIAAERFATAADIESLPCVPDAS
jgi:hypothetical protein